MRSLISSALLLAFIAGEAAAQQAGGKLVVDVAAIHSDKGSVGCSLYNAADGFPSDIKKAIQKHMVSIHDGKAQCEFSGLAPGTYAVAVIHDENGNGKLDTNFLGIPKEGVGVSNDAKGFMGPPKFDKAKFVFSGSVMNILIHMKYL